MQRTQWTSLMERPSLETEYKSSSRRAHLVEVTPGGIRAAPDAVDVRAAGIAKAAHAVVIADVVHVHAARTGREDAAILALRSAARAALVPLREVRRRRRIARNAAALARRAVPGADREARTGRNLRHVPRSVKEVLRPIGMATERLDLRLLPDDLHRSLALRLLELIRRNDLDLRPQARVVVQAVQRTECYY